MKETLIVALVVVAQISLIFFKNAIHADVFMHLH